MATLKRNRKKARGFWFVLKCLLIIAVAIVGICSCILLILYAMLADFGGPWFDELEYLDGPSPPGEALASADFSLRFLEAAEREDTNLVFAPPLLVEGLFAIELAGREKTAIELDQLLVDPERFSDFGGRWVYIFNLIRSSEVPGVSGLFSGDMVGGVERKLSLASDAYRIQDSTFQRLVGLERETSGVQLPGGMGWIAENLTQHTRAGDVFWSISNRQGICLGLSSTFYFTSSWPKPTVKTQTPTVEVGMAPFYVDGKAKMVPTVCTRGWEGLRMNQDRATTVVRKSNYLDAELWLFADTASSKNVENGALISLDDVEHWLHGDTKWVSIEHVHFPCFTVSSAIDVRRVCQRMGVDRPFDPERAEFFDIASDNAFVDRFESNLSVTVDEDGIAPAHAIAPVAAPLTCAKPEFVIDRRFGFAVTQRSDQVLWNDPFLLVGVVKDPTQP